MVNENLLTLHVADTGFPPLSTSTSTSTSFTPSPSIIPTPLTFSPALSAIDHLQKAISLIKELALKTKKEKFDRVTEEINCAINKINQHQTHNHLKFQQQILEKLNTLTTNTHQPPSFAQKTAATPKPKAIILKAKNSETNIGEIGRKLKTKIKENKNIQINNVIINPIGIRIISQDQKVKEKISKLIDKDDCDKLEIQEVRKLDPQISVVIPSDQIEDEEAIKLRNSIPTEEEVKIIIKRDLESKSRFKKSLMIIRMSRKARETIEKRGKIFIGCQSTSFQDNFNVRTCSNCNQIGHSKSFCSAPPSCRKCENEHTTETCTLDSTKNKHCLLCKNSGHKNYNHHPRSDRCEAYQLAIKRLIDITDYDYQHYDHLA